MILPIERILIKPFGEMIYLSQVVVLVQPVPEVGLLIQQFTAEVTHAAQTVMCLVLRRVSAVTQIFYRIELAHVGRENHFEAL